jgi:hypothetical protein
MYRNELKVIERKRNAAAAPLEQADSVWFTADLTFL